MIGFEREPDRDLVTATLTTAESLVLTDLAQQLITLLDERVAESPADLLLAQLGIGGGDSAPLDPAMARLLPDAYTDDSAAASEHRQLTELSLVQRKIANARTVAATATPGRIELDDGTVQSWLRTLTDLRLVIAARLQIEDDGDRGTGDEETIDLYDWLGFVQGMLVECLP